MYTKNDVGITVYHPSFGEGTVVSFTKDIEYPVRVNFGAEEITFSTEGKQFRSDVYPTLSRKPWPKAVTEREFQEGDLVIVRLKNPSTIPFLATIHSATDKEIFVISGSGHDYYPTKEQIVLVENLDQIKELFKSR